MKISVLMTVYNSEAYVQNSIDSILAQTYGDFEFIIVNDGSNDRSKLILDNIDDNRVKIFHFEKNMGVANARNFGITQAKADWIVMQDSDDISLPHRIEKQLNYIKNNPNLIAVGSLVECFSDECDLNNEYIKNINYWFNSKVTKDDINKAKYYGCPLVHPALVISKEALIKTGGYDSQYKACEDYDLIMKLLEIGPIENVPEVLFKYRVHSFSRSHIDNEITNSEINNISLKYLIGKLNLQKNYLPSFIVFGTKKSCKYFKKNIENNRIIKVHDYMYRYNKDLNIYAYTNKAVQLFNNKKIDGILILDGPYTSEIINDLQEKGMQENINFFKITNFIED